MQLYAKSSGIEFEMLIYEVRGPLVSMSVTLKTTVGDQLQCLGDTLEQDRQSFYMIAVPFMCPKSHRKVMCGNFSSQRFPLLPITTMVPEEPAVRIFLSRKRRSCRRSGVCLLNVVNGVSSWLLSGYSSLQTGSVAGW